MNIYIHVPFCAQRCSYCDFYTQTNLGLRARYMDAVLAEMELRHRELVNGEQVRNIYLGGGTPSLLNPKELECIFDRLYTLYPIAPNAEITIECNPDDITTKFATALERLPINRVSMGVQSFQEDDLKFLNRRHDRNQVYTAVRLLREVGITNLSLDLIYGLPNQTTETWSDNIQRIIALNIPHISAYHLIYEEGTPLTRLRDLGKVSEVSEEDSLRFFEMLINGLCSAGYEHYEISNFAKPNAYARLNTGYWQGEPYIGLGPAAHSYDGNARSHNVASIRLYTEAIMAGNRPASLEILTREEQMHEYIMTRLRTQWGIDLSDYQARYGDTALALLLQAATPHLTAGRLHSEGNRLKLTSQGIFTSDAIIVDLFI